MKTVLSKLFLFGSIALVFFSGSCLYQIMAGYQSAQKEYEAIEELAVTKNSEETKEDGYPASGRKTKVFKGTPAPIRVNFPALKKINPEIIGWLYLGSLSISYPIVQGEDNDYYLHHSAKRSENSSGAIFADCDNGKAFKDPNTILYGHNMKSGQMFGTLKKLLQKEVYAQDPYLWLLTPEGEWKYKIFAAYTTSEDSDTYTLFDGFGKEYDAYVQKMHKRAEYDTGEVPDGTKPVLTLSTCSYSAVYRTVVQAVQIKNETDKAE